MSTANEIEESIAIYIFLTIISILLTLVVGICWWFQINKRQKKQSIEKTEMLSLAEAAAHNSSTDPFMTHLAPLQLKNDATRVTTTWTTVPDQNSPGLDLC